MIKEALLSILPLHEVGALVDDVNGGLDMFSGHRIL
jgi:hypothetical protein